MTGIAEYLIVIENDTFLSKKIYNINYGQIFWQNNVLEM